MSNDIVKIQRVDGSLFYDALELPFTPIDKPSILKHNAINIIQAIHTNDVAANVYRKSEIDTGLNLKADKTNTYPNAEMHVA